MTDAEKLKEKFVQWTEYLGTDGNEVDSNSISGVLQVLYWEMGAYESYVAICKDDPTCLLATLLFGNLTAYNYIQIQALRIRRLCEQPSNRETSAKDKTVYSLCRLADEMKQERTTNRFTKANICKVFNIPPSSEEVNTQIQSDLSIASGSFSADSLITGNTLTSLNLVCDKNGLLNKSITNYIDKRLTFNI